MGVGTSDVQKAQNAKNTKTKQSTLIKAQTPPLVCVFLFCALFGFCDLSSVFSLQHAKYRLDFGFVVY
jgi:hypothetical protein